MEELDERLNAAYGSRTRGELETLVADVIVPGRPGLGGRRAAAPACPSAAARAARTG